MRNRTALIIGTILVLVLLLGGGTVGAMALTHSGFMGNGYNQTMMGNQQQEDADMMGTQQGGSGMMGGYQPTSTQQGTPMTGTTRVAMHNSAYQPANMQVRVGTTVTWTNEDTVPHTVTFRTPGMMGSDMMSDGQSFSYTFRTPGTYQYYCAVHPYMVATVTVVS